MTACGSLIQTDTILLKPLQQFCTMLCNQSMNCSQPSMDVKPRQRPERAGACHKIARDYLHRKPHSDSTCNWVGVAHVSMVSMDLLDLLDRLALLASFTKHLTDLPILLPGKNPSNCIQTTIFPSSQTYVPLQIRLNQ